jgi:hypothetical protein
MAGCQNCIPRSHHGLGNAIDKELKCRRRRSNKADWNRTIPSVSIAVKRLRTRHGDALVATVPVESPAKHTEGLTVGDVEHCGLVAGAPCTDGQFLVAPRVTNTVGNLLSKKMEITIATEPESRHP